MNRVSNHIKDGFVSIDSTVDSEIPNIIIFTHISLIMMQFSELRIQTSMLVDEFY